MRLLLVTIFAIIASGHTEQVRFDSHQLYSLTLDTEDQVNVLRNIEHNSESGYLFWNSINIGRDVDIMVAPYKLTEFQDLLKVLNVKHALKVENVQE